LQQAGRDVLMVEEGGLHRTESFTTDPATMIRRLYRDAGTSMILGNPPVIFAEGRCVGGSTVINGGMSWRTPEPVLDRWERGLGLSGFGPRAMEPYFAEAERIIVDGVSRVGVDLAASSVVLGDVRLGAS